MATPTKWGHEFLANTGTKGTQYDPTIAGLADGRFVIAWTDGSGDKSGSAVRAQVFNADGSKVGGEFRVNTTTADSQGSPTGVALSDGRFVVAWADWSKSGGDKSGSAVRAQIFDADGNRSGGEFLVNTTAKRGQFDPTITNLADGHFVVAWQSSQPVSNSGIPTDDVRAQIFNADSSKSGGEFVVSTTTQDFQGRPTITGLADGRFVAAWIDWNDSGADIRAQVFSGDGSKSGGEFVVNTTTEGFQDRPTLTGLVDGGFALAWIDNPTTLRAYPVVTHTHKM
jgi:hypothetical protein